MSLTIIKRKDDKGKKKPQAKAAPKRSPVALPRWHKELEREQRTIYNFDDLHRAACCEMSALEAPEVRRRDRQVGVVEEAADRLYALTHVPPQLGR